MVGDDMYHWEAFIKGPKDSLYQGYEFKVDIKLPENYPYSPMIVKFITPIQHVNVNKNGDICMDILKDEWSSSQNIQSILISIISLMRDPNIKDPFNSDLAELYRTNEDKYKKAIHDFCKEKAISCKH